MEQDITGRDRHVITTALAYAIATIQSLPHDRQEYSDCRDMITLFNALVPDENERGWRAKSVFTHTGRRPRFVEDLSHEKPTALAYIEMAEAALRLARKRIEEG